MKIINIEDNILKHIAIKRALQTNGIQFIDHASTTEEGLDRIIIAAKSGAAYDLLILDMHFSVGGVNNPEAGMYVIEKLKEVKIDIPIIICSSLRYDIPGVVGCIYYNKSNDLDWDMREMLIKVKTMNR